MAEDFKLNRALYTDKEKTLVLEEDDPRAAFVIGGKGSVVSEEDVKKYKLDDSHKLKEEESEADASAVDPSVEMGTVTPEDSKDVGEEADAAESDESKPKKVGSKAAPAKAPAKHK
jgi:hypothetical protein